MALLEVAANSAASAFAAQAGGAGRVELCASLDEGGVTPSHGTLVLAREGLDIPLYVLIRPRAGDFVYEDHEIEAMLDDIMHCRELGCDGVVVGALTPEGEVDVDACQRFLGAADGMGVTFHRAFDLVVDQGDALETLISLGFERVLTSGGMASAVAGAGRLARLVTQAGGRIVVMPGAGIEPGNIAALREATGAHEFHASAKRRLPSAMRRSPADALGMGAGETRSDTNTVQALVAAIA
ncbi:copper homeostasis protein CutC [Luteibacter aegosomatissinici]|uniref:copper homeostasis protein CutC n=1 Tax=Luteibacter aegosomatissinici TaxID=2911539 RepID=UPI001FFBB97E|nr:copper homeostasis protein CutC [Luteibacter aegosomatissinici]UPG96276.1 copper homeostasis protein CutC [Luteibacter aegosomatissinici]